MILDYIPCYSEHIGEVFLSYVMDEDYLSYCGRRFKITDVGLISIEFEDQYIDFNGGLTYSEFHSETKNFFKKKLWLRDSIIIKERDVESFVDQEWLFQYKLTIGEEYNIVKAWVDYITENIDYYRDY